MIELTRLNKSRIVINCDWIETMEKTPDTVVTLTNGHKYVVTETVDDIISKVIRYKQQFGGSSRMPLVPSENDGK